MSETDTSQSAYEEALRLKAARRPAEAAAILQTLADTRLTLGVALNLGLCLFELGRYPEAERWILLAARNRPAEPATRQSLGALYAAQGKVGEAELELRTALAFKPDYDAAKGALGALLLSIGDYAQGWPLLEARTRLSPDMVVPINPSFPQWRGEPLAGKSVLIWIEQGFGDQIQFARFANEMKARGAARITLACRPALAHLFTSLKGVDEVMGVAVGAHVVVAQHDYWSRYFSLPEHLGITLQNLPSAPYLAVPADRVSHGPAQGRVGLAWRASPTGFNAAAKGLSDRVAQRLLDLGVVSLDPADTGVGDFADTAAIIDRLDLVVSIDTSVAHLAGAMGKPCWTLLPYVHTDWRWLRGRADSPWYPTMRLYRQAAPDDWSPVVERVKTDLRTEGYIQ